jgi:MFS superfamily sulfate permease-like transporter
MPGLFGSTDEDLAHPGRAERGDQQGQSPTPVRSLLVAAAPVTSIDVTAADALTELDQSLQAKGIQFSFAELKDPVKDKLMRLGLMTWFGETRFFLTIDAAISSFVIAQDANR